MKAINGKNLKTVSEAKATEMQEKASLVVIKEGIKRNKIFTKNEIVFGEGSTGKQIQKEIFEQYPAEYHKNFDWLETFWKQQDTFLQSKIGGKKIMTGSQYQEYDRDNSNGFMDFISDLVRENYGIVQKDTWNPADIWIVKDKEKVRKQLIDAAKSKNIKRLNDTLRAMLKNKEVIGISLKKITKGKPARWEVVNLTKTPFSEKGDYNFELSKIKFGGKLKSDGTGFTSQDTMLYIYENKSPWVDLQVTQTTRRFANLKFEPTQRGASGARLGKAPVAMVEELLLDYKIKKSDVSELMSNYYFPKSIEEFLEDKEYYKQAFDRVKSTFSYADMGSSSGEEFVKATENLFIYAEKAPGGKGPKSEFAIRAGKAMTKLMQLHFLDILARVKRNKGQKQLDELLTSLIFLSMKKGKRFGPFGKLY